MLKRVIVIAGVLLLLGGGVFFARKAYRQNIDGRLSAEIGQIIESAKAELDAVVNAAGDSFIIYDSASTPMTIANLSGEAAGCSVNVTLRKAFEGKLIEPAKTVWNTISVDKVKVVDNPLYTREDQLETVNLIGTRRVTESFSVEDLESYLLSTGSFGVLGKGIVSASLQLYGKRPEDLNALQAEYLAEFYQTTEDYVPSLEDFANQAGCTASSLQVVFDAEGQSKAPTNAIAQVVREELLKLKDEGRLEGNGLLHVKTSINSKLQGDLQSLVDTSAATNVEQGSDGGYAFEVSVTVVDSATGYITAYIPSRTGFNQLQREVLFDIGQLQADFRLAGTYIADKKSSISLISWEDDKGVSELIGLDRLVREHFAESETSMVNILEGYTEFDSAPDLILEITSATGNTVYTAQARSASNNLSSLVKEELFTDSDGVKRASVESDTGSIKFWKGSQFGAGIYCGAYAQGYTGFNFDLGSFASSVNNCIQAYYKQSNSGSKVVPQAVQSLITSNRNDNYGLVKAELQEKFDTLQHCKIENSADVAVFEELYQDLIDTLKALEPYLLPEHNSALKANQETIRRDKSRLLVGAAA